MERGRSGPFHQLHRLCVVGQHLPGAGTHTHTHHNSPTCVCKARVTWVSRLQDIDGQALLLLTLPTVQECMDLKLGPAIKLCHQIERVKVAFYRQFAN